MMYREHSLSVVILMYDEEENIAQALGETTEYLSGNVEDWEILVVDDGSTDGGAEIVRRDWCGDPRIRLLAHSRNRGMGAGMATGIAEVSKEYFVINAADGQIPVVELDKMLPLLGEADIVLTSYEGGRSSFLRDRLSGAFRLYMRVVAGISFTMDGLYLFPASTARDLLPFMKAETFFFSFELIQRGIEAGLTTRVAQIRCLPRARGASKVLGLRRVSRVAAEAGRYGLRKRMGG